MSDETQPATQGETGDKPDDREPTPERKVELEAAYTANRKAKKPPYQGVQIKTSGELAWIYRQRHWSPQGNWWSPPRTANFRGADFTGVLLEGADLGEADLREARFDRANLRGATLTVLARAASFREANLSMASMGSGEPSLLQVMGQLGRQLLIPVALIVGLTLSCLMLGPLAGGAVRLTHTE